MKHAGTHKIILSPWPRRMVNYGDYKRGKSPWKCTHRISSKQHVRSSNTNKWSSQKTKKPKEQYTLYWDEFATYFVSKFLLLKIWRQKFARHQYSTRTQLRNRVWHIDIIIMQIWLWRTSDNAVLEPRYYCKIYHYMHALLNWTKIIKSVAETNVASQMVDRF